MPPCPATTGETVVASTRPCVCPRHGRGHRDARPGPEPGEPLRCIPDPCPRTGHRWPVVRGPHRRLRVYRLPAHGPERREVDATRAQCACDDGYVDYSPAAGDRRSIVVEEVRYPTWTSPPPRPADACAPGHSSGTMRRSPATPWPSAAPASPARATATSPPTPARRSPPCAKTCDADEDCGDGGLYTCSTADPAAAAERETSGGRRGVCVARTTCTEVCPDGRTACAGRDCAAGIPSTCQTRPCARPRVRGGRVVCVPPAGAASSPPACTRRT